MLYLANQVELFQSTCNKCYSRFSVPRSFSLNFVLHILFQTCFILFYSILGDFLKTLEDPDLNVRRVALVTFNSAAHNKPSLIRDLLDTVLPHLYNETKVRKELIREVSCCFGAIPSALKPAIKLINLHLFVGGDGSIQTHGG